LLASATDLRRVSLEFAAGVNDKNVVGRYYLPVLELLSERVLLPLLSPKASRLVSERQQSLDVVEVRNLRMLRRRAEGRNA
jgi:hypothetical protein